VADTSGVGAVMATTPSALSIALFKTLDSGDVDGWADHLTEDVRLQFGNAAPVTGRDAVRDLMRGFLGRVRGVRHEVLDESDVDDTVILRLRVTCVRADGAEVTVPAANILHLRGDRIADYEVYVDLSPVAA
jgi:ketosteroid isomerase-like protein